MAKKTSKRSSSVAKKSSPAGPPLVKTVLRKLFGLFQEDLPISEYRGSTRCDTDVSGVDHHQRALETICGGRSAKSHKLSTTAVLRPDAREETTWVEISRRIVGFLKPADIRHLQKELAKAGITEPCALRVAALVQGGKKKKNGDVEPFTVEVALPPKLPKKPKQVQFEDPENADDDDDGKRD